MYEKDGEKYFIVDSHSHFWDASRENWKPGREEFAKGWIDCFYGYHQLGPPETHWDYEKYLKVSEADFERDMFEEGHVDVAIFQSTYLKDWYTNGFNTAEQNATLLEKYPDRLIVNGRWDPREGDAGMKQLVEDHASTASRASSSTRPSGTRAPAAGSSPTRSPTRSWRSARSSGSRTSTCTRARRSGR